MTTHAMESAPRNVESLKEETPSLPRSLWLVGLGALVTAAEGGRHFARYLMEQGQKAEPAGRKGLQTVRGAAGRAVSSARSGVDRAVRDVGERAKAVAGRSEDLMDEKIIMALQRVGVPSREEVEALKDRMEELAVQIEKLGAAGELASAERRRKKSETSQS